MSGSEKDTNGKTGQKSIASRVGRFFKDLKGEMKKVVWPGQKQIINNTGIVIVFVLIAGAVIGGFDFALSALVNFIFRQPV